jgi:UDP-3-O-[3-hydroxymyristoyl] N-acetylglucosamine deacetylase
MDFPSKTLNRPVYCEGVGLHTGETVSLAVHPAHPQTGIRFKRLDVTYCPSIRADLTQVQATQFATTIGFNGYSISTVEHLMAALSGSNITDALVEVNGPEVPIMDGSAAPFLSLFKEAGTRTQSPSYRILKVNRAFSRSVNEKIIMVLPDQELKITYTIDFDHPFLGIQTFTLSFSEGQFEQEISRARTFGFLAEVDALKRNGYAKGGSLDNAVVIDREQILNQGGLRYQDEFVRHKILDFIGDLSLLGHKVLGHFIIYKSGHTLNHLFLKDLLTHPRHWEWV